MRRLGVLVVVVALLLVLPIFAHAQYEDLVINAGKAIDELNANNGRYSSEKINQSVIDLVYVSQGTVTTHTYIGEAETLTINTFSVTPQENPSATNKITRFVFELTNRYRPQGTTLPLVVSQDKNTVRTYAYGTMKDEAIWAVVYGLQDCLNNPPFVPSDSGDGGGGWIEPYSPANISQTIIERTSTFTINSTTYTVNDTVKTMDVAPEVKNSRTFVPVRYLAYSLGVPEEGITWDGEKQEVAITKDETTIGLTIGSNIQAINGEQKEMDVAPYIKNGRTMLPARWVAEPLGAEVTWNAESQQVEIKIIKEVTEQGQ